MDTSGDNYKLASNGKVRSPIQQLPPLENPLIVDALAYQACRQTPNIDDIKNFRLVCKLWRDALPEPWKSGFNIHRISQHPNLTEQEGRIEEDTITLAQLRDVADINILSIGTVELQSWKMEESQFLVKVSTAKNQQQKLPRLENWFWITFGSIMTSITFNNCEFLGPFTIFGETFLKAVPNLKRLRVINCLISALGWETLHERHANQRKFFDHINLKNVYLDLDASDRQFNHLWSLFQRSLPKLEHISVKRLNRAHSSNEWAAPLIRYWIDSKLIKKLTFSESGECFQDFQELYRFSMYRSTRSDSLLKVVWHVNQTLPFPEKLLTFPDVSYLKSMIQELHPIGQIFPNLCFLTSLEHLLLLVWTNDDGFDNHDGNNVKSPYDMASYSCIYNHKYPTLKEIYIQDSIEIDSCSCKPERKRNIATIARAGKLRKSSFNSMLVLYI